VRAMRVVRLWRVKSETATIPQTTYCMTGEWIDDATFNADAARGVVGPDWNTAAPWSRVLAIESVVDVIVGGSQ